MYQCYVTKYDNIDQKISNIHVNNSYSQESLETTFTP